ncbi:hypothetical protein U1Q18_031246 [Sarracenia purpurea var. burkii]
MAILMQGCSICCRGGASSECYLIQITVQRFSFFHTSVFKVSGASGVSSGCKQVVSSNNTSVFKQVPFQMCSFGALSLCAAQFSAGTSLLEL